MANTFSKPGFDNKDSKKTLWSIQQLEDKWFSEINNYLFGKPELSEEEYFVWFKHFAPNFVSAYRNYNHTKNQQFKNQPGAFSINDIVLSIPPENITVEVTNNTIDLPILRSKSSVKIDTGQGEISVMISVVLTDDPITGNTLEDEIKYKLIPLMVQLKNMPFCHVDNEYLKNKIIMGYTDRLAEENDYTKFLDLPEIMLTYQNYKISTTAESPRILRVDLSFLLFNYNMYMPYLAYPDRYEMDGTHRRLELDKPIVPLISTRPEFSLPFYQFHTKELQKREDSLYYTHKKDPRRLLGLKYYEYIPVPTYLVSKKYGEKLINLEQTTTARDTRQFSVNENYGVGSSDHAVIAMKYFISKGWTPEQAAGIVGNLQQESGKNMNPKAHNTNEDARGIAQWRFERITKFYELYNKDILDASFEEQLAYVNWELNHSEISAGNKLKLSTTPGEAAIAIDRYYERSAGTERQRRIDNAETLFREYDSTAPIVQETPATTPNPLANITNETKPQLNPWDTGYYITAPTQQSTTTKLNADEENIHQLIQEYSKIPGVKFIKYDSMSRFTYIRIPKSINISAAWGIEITGMEAFGGIEVARIPISGQRIAAHQYMGGSVDKLVLQMVVYDETGDYGLNQIQSVFNIAAENARKYKSFAAFDGVEIVEDYINKVLGGKYYVLDDIRIESHPQIPNGSLVSMVLTDFTKTKEQAERALDFHHVNADFTYESYYKSILQELFANHLDIEVYTNNKSDYQRTGRERYEYQEYFVLTFKIANLSSFEESVQNIFTDLQTRLNNAELRIDRFNNQKYIDTFDVVKYMDHTKSQNSDRIKDIFSSKEGDLDFYSILKDWAATWSKHLAEYKDRNGKELIPETNKIYTDDVKSSLNRILSPAYIDFDLPPSINPDYYFFQAHKCLSHNSKKAKFNELAIRKAEEVYKELTWHLNPEDAKSGYRVIEALEQDIILPNREKQSPLMKPTNLRDLDMNKDPNQLKAASGDYATNRAMNLVRVEKDPNLDQIRIGILDKSADTEEYKKTFDNQNAIVYTDDITFNDYALRKRLSENESSNLDMMHAFPVFKVFIIEEDETELLAPFRQDFNDMFGLNAIQEIRMVEHSDQPADLLVLNFVDMTGRFTSAKYKEYSHQEKVKDPDIVDTKEENPLKGLMIKDGTVLQLRVGYDNNINNLSTKFNGYIVSIGDENNEYQLLCQSFGVELVQAIKYPDHAEEIATYNAETKEILQWAVNQPEVKHFGRWKFKSNSNFQISDDAGGVVKFNYGRIRPDGSVSRSWTFTKDEGEANIIAPEELSNQGIKTWEENIEDDLFGYLNVLKWPSLLFNLFTNYWVHNTTVWQVVDEMCYRYPGYVAKVLPFEDRCTLFYGHPDSPYFYRRFTINEGETIAALRQQLEDIRNDKDNKFSASQILASQWDMYQNIKGMKNKFNSLTKQIIESEKKYKLQAKNIKSLEEFIREKTTKIFRQYHVATSSNHIIRNLMKADYRDVYTEVQVGWTEDGQRGDPSQDKFDKLTVMKMNDFLEEEDIRSKYLPAINVEHPFGAYQYAATQLFRESKKLYKGDIQMIGNPKIKPFDHIMLLDESTQTYGPIEVNQHILSIVPGQGMISIVKPNMVSSIRNLVTMSNSYAHSYISAGHYGVEKMNSSSNFWEKHFATEQGVVQTGDFIQTAGLGTGVGLGVAAAAGLVGIPIFTLLFGAAVILGTAQLNHQLFLTAKYRNPIILHPVMRMGTPYLYGMNTYKNLGLAAWYKEKLNLLKEDVTAFKQVVDLSVKYALEDLL